MKAMQQKAETAGKQTNTLFKKISNEVWRLLKPWTKWTTEEGSTN